ncbi:MAG: hypothetical protein K1X67_16370 [Fimbriimonadaceae bacterium]|nr:hypothetical protein [Fimbriimonadaceae bacterium]
MQWRAFVLLAVLGTAASAQQVVVVKDTYQSGAWGMGQPGIAVNSLDDLSSYSIGIVEIVAPQAGFLDSFSVSVLLPNNYNWANASYAFFIGRTANELFTYPLTPTETWTHLRPVNTDHTTVLETFGGNNRHNLRFDLRPMGFSMANGEHISIGLALKHSSDGRSRRISFANPSSLVSGTSPDAYTYHGFSPHIGTTLDNLNYPSTCYAARVTMFTSSGTNLSGTLDFQDWTGDPIPQVTIEFLNLSMQVAETRTAILNANGSFAIPHPAPGAYYVGVKYGHWLRKVVGPYSMPATSQVGTLHLVNGDIDEDNEVGIGDYALLSANYGAAFAPADLDGDGEVGIGDYAVLSANYGEIGD